MKKTLFLSAAVSLFALSANALELSPYVSAKLKFIDFNGRMSGIEPGWGKSGMDINGDNTYGGAIAAGIANKLCSGDAIRLELEYNKTADSETTWFWNEGKVETSAESYMLNAYYDFDIDSKFTPYIGAGIGSAKVKYKMKDIDGPSESFSDRKFAWQAGAGIAYAATDHVSVDVGYRYVDYGHFKKEQPQWDGAYKFHTKANELYVGLRYSF